MRLLFPPIVLVFGALISKHFCLPTELDALALEEENEGPSYLADLNKLPDFIDEAPVALDEVRNKQDIV